MSGLHSDHLKRQVHIFLSFSMVKHSLYVSITKGKEWENAWKCLNDSGWHFNKYPVFADMLNYTM